MLLLSLGSHVVACHADDSIICPLAEATLKTREMADGHEPTRQTCEVPWATTDVRGAPLRWIERRAWRSYRRVARHNGAPWVFYRSIV